jgi:hypothetical protein
MLPRPAAECLFPAVAAAAAAAAACYYRLLQGSVQQQLEQLCDISPVYAPTRLRRQRAANEKLWSDNVQLRSDKEQLQAQVLALRMHLGHSQAQVQQPQQQLTAAQSGKKEG